MPDIRAILKARGVSDDVAESMVGNAAYTPILEGFIKDAEDGKTAFLNAQKIEADLRKWNEETVAPYAQQKDRETASARAEAARLREHLQAMKDAGHDVPDAYFQTQPAAAAAATVSDAKYASQDDMVNTAKASMAMISLSEKYRDLTGQGLDLETEYSDFEKNRRPQERLRDYVDRKYDLAAKDAAKKAERAATERKVIEDAAIDRWKRENPQSANPELARPAASKFDRFKQLPAENRNSWQTREGRESATMARQEKYRELLSK